MVLKSILAHTPHKRDVLLLSLMGVFITLLVLGNIVGTTKFVTIFTLTMS